MDLKKIAVEETAVLHLRDANDELLYDGEGDKRKPVTVTLFGPGSKAHARAQAAQNNRFIEKLRKKGKANDSAETTAAERSEFLAGCTKAMDGVEYDGLQGEALFKAVYADVSLGFIADQVAKHLGEWANFTKGSRPA